MASGVRAATLLTAILFPPAPGAAPAAAKTLAAGEVLTLGTDARSLAMGEASLAHGRPGVGELPRTPLGLIGLERGALSFSRVFLIQDISLNHFALGRKAGDLAVGLSVLRLDYGRLDERDAGGTLTGGYHPKDTVVQGSLAGTWRKLELGASFKALDSKIVAKGSALAFDLAGRMAVTEDVDAAAAARNLGGEIQYEDEKEPLPADLAAGLSWKVLPALRLNVDAVYPLYAPTWVALGGEYALAAGAGVEAFLRAGANTRNPELGGLAGFHAGFGLQWRKTTLDYSYDPFGDLGDTHRIGIEYRW